MTISESSFFACHFGTVLLCPVLYLIKFPAHAFYGWLIEDSVRTVAEISHTGIRVASQYLSEEIDAVI
jgi:hypothetical protein